MDYQHVVHGFGPVFDRNSKVLILGSMPSVKSREQQFYYGHPQNRFWKLAAALCDRRVPDTIDEKRLMLLGHRIAVWDVISECEIIGSSDASLKNVIPTDLSVIFAACDIKGVFANGAAAARIYKQYQMKKVGREIIKLPSTSPANAACSFDDLLSEWKIIKEYLNDGA